MAEGDKIEVVEEKKGQDPLLNLVLVGFACFVLGFFVASAFNPQVGIDTTTSTIPVTTTLSASKLSVVVLNDQRCDVCVSGMQALIGQLESIFPELEVESLDYGSEEGKKLYSELDIDYLPAILFSEDVKDEDNYASVEQYLEQKGDYLSLRIGADFDPTAEICDNQVDDNGDGKVDCDDPTCATEWVCMEKLEVPKVELFVMSHCPYGTQMEKAILPVVELLGDKVDFELKFCNYAMHGETEVNEQLIQYCIQKEQNDKFLPYLRCFLEAGNSEACLADVGVDSTALESCVSSVDLEYGVLADFADKSTWISGAYPSFAIYDDDNVKYGVRGSPTLVINEVVAQVARNPASLLEAVCLGFEDAPEDCSEVLSTESPTAGFGWSGSGASSDASCG